MVRDSKFSPSFFPNSSMATFSESGRITDTRSAGGKIVTKRRRRPTTPYDRPPGPPPQSQPKSPNWLTGVIFPATRRIASGAAKILSLVFDSDNSDYSSSSDSEAVANDDNDYDQLDNLCDPEKDHGAPSEAKKCISEVRQLSTQKIEKTRAIEKLLMQGSYSREECERLTQIINSRVVDSTFGGAETCVTFGTPDRIIQNDTDDICSKAITEARKWLEEKKVGSSPEFDGADVSRGLESVAVQHIDNEVASPADIAKTYMRSRPAWASPFAEHFELQTLSTVKSQLSGEGTLLPAGDRYLSSFKKRTPFASGSWNIQEELRRVRLKATEELLQSPSKRIDLPSLALSPRYGEDSLIANLLTTGKGDKGNEPISLTDAKAINFSLNDTAVGSSNDGVLATEIGNGLANEGVMSNPALSFEQYQDSQALKIAGEHAASIPSRPANADLGMEQNDGTSGPPLNDDSQPAHVNGSLAEELRNINETHGNGLPTSQASSLAEEAAVDIHSQKLEQNLTPVKGLEKEKITGNIDEMCEFSEASIEVPVMHETECITNLCESNSIMSHNDDLPRLLTHADKNKLAGKPDAMVLKQEGKKMGRYSRRGKGRGKS